MNSTTQLRSDKARVQWKRLINEFPSIRSYEPVEVKDLSQVQALLEQGIDLQEERTFIVGTMKTHTCDSVEYLALHYSKFHNPLPLLEVVGFYLSGPEILEGYAFLTEPQKQALMVGLSKQELASL